MTGTCLVFSTALNESLILSAKTKDKSSPDSQIMKKWDDHICFL